MLPWILIVAITCEVNSWYIYDKFGEFSSSRDVSERRLYLWYLKGQKVMLLFYFFKSKPTVLSLFNQTMTNNHFFLRISFVIICIIRRMPWKMLWPDPITFSNCNMIWNLISSKCFWAQNGKAIREGRRRMSDLASAHSRNSFRCSYKQYTDSKEANKGSWKSWPSVRPSMRGSVIKYWNIYAHCKGEAEALLSQMFGSILKIKIIMEDR